MLLLMDAHVSSSLLAPLPLMDARVSSNLSKPLPLMGAGGDRTVGAFPALMGGRNLMVPDRRWQLLEVLETMLLVVPGVWGMGGMAKEEERRLGESQPSAPSKTR